MTYTGTASILYLSTVCNMSYSKKFCEDNMISVQDRCEEKMAGDDIDRRVP